MILLDAGALIAIESGDRRLHALIVREHRLGRSPITHGGIVGQVWRGSARQARLARLLPSLRVLPLDVELGRSTGALLARSDTADVLDAALVALTHDDDMVITSDVHDITHLARVAGRSIDVVRV
jgi:predicted nucleic acid-binding protein